ncbi:uncharacterized protein LOC141801911 [Halichoeres trimaculatus]|uniref:uncharacterized protein LOC141801911 n=1 Tax=Halichoeres trimaculatus TaxID=147232 RepID=UPI003D9E11CA
MAAVAVTAELVYRDGQKEKVSVKVENNLSSLISGINELNSNVSRLLSELVDQEKAHGVCAEGEEDESDDEDDEEPEEPPKSEEQPPAKRSKI